MKKIDAKSIAKVEIVTYYFFSLRTILLSNQKRDGLYFVDS